MLKLSGTPLKALVIATVAATSLSLTACNDGSDKSSSSTNASAGASATPTPSFPFEKGTVDKKKFVDALADGLSRTKTYHFDGTMSMRMSGTSMKASLTGDADMSHPSSSKVHLVMTPPKEAKSSEPFEVVSVNGRTYRKQGSKWVESAADSASTQQLNPVESVRESQKYIDKVTYAGEDASGHRFVATADPARMSKEIASYVKEVKYTYWTDDSMRLVRMNSAMSGTEGQAMSVDMNMSKFDKPVTIPSVS